MPTKVQIKGPIITNGVKWLYDWFEMDATCPKDVEEAMNAANGDELEVEINSGGGDVYVGSEIYTALKSYSGKVTVKIVGRAASAAGVIAMGGNKVLISPTAQFMMHNASTYAEGDYRDMDHTSEFLKNWNKSIANAYILKTGMSQDDLLALMDKETWLNAKQAVEYGFADEVMFDEGGQLVAYDNSFMFPPEAINKIRNIALKNNLLPDNAGQQAGFNNVQEDPTEQGKSENPADKQNVNEGSDKTLEIKNVEDLRAAYPEMVTQIEAAAKDAGIKEGKETGVKDERSRIQGIDDISASLDPAMVAAAKYDTPVTAQELAFNAVKTNAAKGIQFLINTETDSAKSGVDNVQTQAAELNAKKQREAAEETAAIDKLADLMNKGGAR